MCVQIDETSQHIDMMSHKQACIDLEKATQFITQVLQVRQTHTVAKRERGDNHTHTHTHTHTCSTFRYDGPILWFIEHNDDCRYLICFKGILMANSTKTTETS